MDKENQSIRVVKKVAHDDNGVPTRTWYEVQYQTWRAFTKYGSPKTYKNKEAATNWALRKKAGACANSTSTEVIA